MYAEFPHNLTYGKLMKLLLIKSVPDLEEVVMHAIYNGQRVNITSVAPLHDVSHTHFAIL